MYIERISYHHPLLLSLKRKRKDIYQNKKEKTKILIKIVLKDHRDMIIYFFTVLLVRKILTHVLSFVGPCDYSLPIKFLSHSIFEFKTLKWYLNSIIARTDLYCLGYGYMNIEKMSSKNKNMNMLKKVSSISQTNLLVTNECL